MKPSLLLVPAALLCLAVGCSSDSDSKAAPYASGGDSNGGASGSGTHIPTGKSGGGSVGESGASVGGEAGGLSDGGESGEGGSGGLQQGVVVVVPPSTCSETASWVGAMQVAGVSTAADEKLLSITVDELDIVFVRGTSLFHAHRTAATGNFDSGTEIVLPTGYDVAGGASLSADGKTLLIVQTDTLGFAALTRDSRTAEFGATADAIAFAALNARAAQTQERCVNPVLSPDGKSLVFAGYNPMPGSTARVYESLLSGSLWGMPQDISQGIFDGSTGKRALPTGLSSDSRTLFYYDEATSKQVARFRDRPDAPLYTAVDLADRDGAVPNSTCKRIYYTSAGDVVVDSN